MLEVYSKEIPYSYSEKYKLYSFINRGGVSLYSIVGNCHAYRKWNVPDVDAVNVANCTCAFVSFEYLHVNYIDTWNGKSPVMVYGRALVNIVVLIMRFCYHGLVNVMAVLMDD